MENEIDIESIAELYKKGVSLNEIARKFGTYATSIRRLLIKNGIDLRYDSSTKGNTYVKGGEKLIEWAKAQGRLVTKAELAAVIGKTKLSPSYFVKYPELGQYVYTKTQHELKSYNEKLYDWLKEHDILYKPNDRTKIKMSLDALLLGDYEGIAIQIDVKPEVVSMKNHINRMMQIRERAKKVGINIIFIDENYFKDLTMLETQLNKFKKS